jgi:hypothetical protein
MPVFQFLYAKFMFCCIRYIQRYSFWYATLCRLVEIYQLHLQGNLT